MSYRGVARGALGALVILIAAMILFIAMVAWALHSAIG